MTVQAHPTHEERVAARRPALKHALTVAGPVREDQLGFVLPHEHILVDFRACHEPFYPDLAERPVELDMLGRLRRHPLTCLDNLQLNDPALMCDELRAFAQMGGGTIADLTSRGPGRDVAALARLAEQTGIRIIAGTGLYAPRYYPANLAQETVDGLAAQFTGEVEQGIEGTAVRAGVIGLICIDDPADEQQEKILQAAARASLRTGAPLALRCPPGAGFAAVHALLQQEGLPASKVLLSGMDRFMAEEDRLRPASLGYYLLFDGVGQEYYVRGGESRVPRDPERLRALKGLVEKGYLFQLLVSQGIDRKMFLVRYGGWGYGHIARNLIPMMTRERFAPKQITTMTMYNPARALAFL